MLLREVQYTRPDTLDAALEALAANDGARALAGGQTLVNVMKARAAAPDVLVDLNRLDALREIRRGEGGSLEVGAMATYSQIMRDSAVAEARPILAEVGAQIADVQVRNRGTLGGNVCSNDPTNHYPPLMVALGATMVVRSGDGEREIPAADFFLGVYFTAVGPGELLTAIRIPPADGARDGFAAVALGVDGTSIANAAAVVEDGGARIAIGCVGATPALLETEASEEAARRAVETADIDPPSDVHASADYRKHLSAVCAGRAVRQALDREG